MKNKYWLLLIIAFVLVIPYNVGASEYSTGVAFTGQNKDNVKVQTDKYLNAIKSKANDIIKYRSSDLTNGFRYNLNLGYKTNTVKDELYAFFFKAPGYYIYAKENQFKAETYNKGFNGSDPTIIIGYPYNFGRNYNSVDSFPRSSIYKAYPTYSDGNITHIYLFGIENIRTNKNGEGKWASGNTNDGVKCTSACTYNVVGNVSNNDIINYIKANSTCQNPQIVSKNLSKKAWYGSNIPNSLNVNPTLSDGTKNPFYNTGNPIFTNSVNEFMKKFSLISGSAVTKEGNSLKVNEFKTASGLGVGEVITSDYDLENNPKQKDYEYYLPYVIEIEAKCNDVTYCKLETNGKISNNSSGENCSPKVDFTLNGKCGNYTPYYNPYCTGNKCKDGKDSTSEKCYLTSTSSNEDPIFTVSLETKNKSLGETNNTFMKINPIELKVTFNKGLMIAGTDSNKTECQEKIKEKISVELKEYIESESITVNVDEQKAGSLNCSDLSFSTTGKTFTDLTATCKYKTSFCPSSTTVSYPSSNGNCPGACKPISTENHIIATKKSGKLTFNLENLNYNCKYVYNSNEIKVSYHQISLENPFAGKDGAGNRTIGDNWDQKTEDGTSFTEKYITETIDDIHNEPMYIIELNRGRISEIRNSTSKNYVKDYTENTTTNTNTCDNKTRICAFAKSIGIDANDYSSLEINGVKVTSSYCDKNGIYKSSLITELKNNGVITGGRCVEDNNKRNSLKCE